MIVDSHEHIMFPAQMQLEKLDDAGVDKAILFCSTPHPEKAATLAELEEEMNSLDRILRGANRKEDNIERLRANTSEVVKAVEEHPGRFMGFGGVPLGLSLSETRDWIEKQIACRPLCGIGEFTPGDDRQILQLETVLEAMRSTRPYPVWVHTFSPVTANGIRALASLCERYPEVPVIFGHLGETNWMEVIRLAAERKNMYLDLSAAYTSIAVKMTLTELPEKCLYSSDAPYGEPYLCRQLIEFVSPSPAVAKMALGENILRLLDAMDLLT